MIDAGVSLRRMKNSLSAAGIAPDDIDIVLITHDHYDHIRHLGKFAGPLWKADIYDSDTVRALVFDSRVKEVDNAFLRPCECMSVPATRVYVHARSGRP